MATGQTQAANPPQNNEHSPSPAPVSWDGDRMFNIYIYDYCIKRGYQKTARELLAEAEIPHDSQPPINAKQGLLFEWWSVFWVLFTAKSSGNGTDDALLYTQHQAQQVNQRQAQARAPQPPANAQRYLTAANGPRPAGGPPGSLPNGVTPAATQPPGQPVAQNGNQTGPWAGQVPQPNGIAGPSHATGPTYGTPAQPMMHPQRPGAVPQRPPNGAPFQSPTMAHSPQQTGSAHPGPQPPHMSGPMAAQNAMAQMRPGMYPPGGPPMMMNNSQQPAAAFQPLPGASASHPNSPAAHAINQSPSMANRQPQMPPGAGGPQPGIRQLTDASVNSDFFRIEATRLPALKEELGLSAVDLPSMSSGDKQRLVDLARERGAIMSQAKLGPGPPQNATPGPSNPHQQMAPGRALGPPFAQQAQQNQRAKRNSTSPGDENDQSQNDSSPANKRPRTSPSGPDQPQAPPPMAPLLPGYPPQQPMSGGPGGPQHQPGMIPLPGSNGSFAGTPRMAPQNMNVPGHNPMPGPHMNNSIVPSSMMQYRQSMSAIHKTVPGGGPHGMPGNAPSPAAAGSPYPGPSDPSHSRPGTGQYGGQMTQNRPGPQGKPASMMPPPSPSTNHAKNPAKVEGAPDGLNNAGPGVQSSPRNRPATTGGGQSQPPPQSGPSQQQNQGFGGTAPPTPSPAAASITTPSPAAILGGSQQGGSQGQQPPSGQPPQLNSQRPPSAAPPPSSEFIMSNDFMQSLGMNSNSFDVFDSSLFQPDPMGAGTDFDRDFREWFNPDTM